MWKAGRKSRTKNPYGKKRKKSNLENLRGRSTPARSDEGDSDRPSVVGDDALVNVGLAPPPTAHNASGSGRIRLDTAMLHPSQVAEVRQNAENKLHDLSSTGATQRKCSLLGDPDNAAATPLDETRFVIVSLTQLNELMRAVKCKLCSGDVEIGKEDREYGLAVKLVLKCANCSDVSTAWSSPRVDGESKAKPFAINVLGARAMQSTGKQQTAFNDVFSSMNISSRGLHNKTWQSYVKTKLTPAAVRASRKVTADCARSVRQLYAELDLANPGNIAVSYDGSWMTRGHSSHIGVGTVIELFTGLVLDYVVLSNFCAGCERAPKESDPAYEEWKAKHLCQRNTTKKAGEMEVEAALILFQRSWERHKLRYTTVVSDGDCRTYLALRDADVYGFIKILKEECVNHVQKRMGTQLRNLPKQRPAGSESLSGRGRLTGDLINKLTSYYGWAIKSHKGDVPAMHKAVMATYYHVTSNDAVSNHSLCPTGPDSPKGSQPPSTATTCPPHVCEALLPVYERLADHKLLERCQRGKTQNSNESLHSVIWSLAPKERHASLHSVEAAVAEAVMRFNAGSQLASSKILQELNMTVGTLSSTRMAEKDRRRTKDSSRRRTSAENVQRTLKKRHLGGASSQDDYAAGAY
ncbi:hypothetical protein HPB48_015378 [Haemaphysalis longicornis]|uniref:Mutator-like transposase domain-containing protein n=1 Tax=Haemaphysalis longicornis TaxID=44386 RepID=A0A9J6GTX8_HAELO|nr:hypothetical protein HPB48_015378 [Haemaphysalis longicornis]